MIPTPTAPARISRIATDLLLRCAVVLDPSAAGSAAIAYLMGETGTDHAVSADGSQVRVEVSRQATTAFLQVLGVTHVEIRAHAVAAPRTGAGGP